MRSALPTNSGFTPVTSGSVTARNGFTPVTSGSVTARNGFTPVTSGSVTARSGFTLIEVIVALTVAGVLILTYLGVERQSTLLVETSRAALEHVEFAQTFLTERPPYQEQEPTPSLAPWPGKDRWRFKLDREPLIYGQIYTLQTEVDGDLATWEWIGF